MNAANTWFAGASPYRLPTGENVLTTSYMPGSNFANVSASSNKGQRTEIPAHGLIVLDASPLRVHRHFRAIETAMKRRRDKSRRLTDKFIGHTNEEIDEPLLVGRLDCKDVYQSNHVHRHDDLRELFARPEIRRPIR
jgi:hypothetical protein